MKPGRHFLLHAKSDVNLGLDLILGCSMDQEHSPTGWLPHTSNTNLFCRASNVIIKITFKVIFKIIVKDIFKLIWIIGVTADWVRVVENVPGALPSSVVNLLLPGAVPGWRNLNQSCQRIGFNIGRAAENRICKDFFFRLCDTFPFLACIKGDSQQIEGGVLSAVCVVINFSTVNMCIYQQQKQSNVIEGEESNPW